MTRSVAFCETVEHHGVTLVVRAARGRDKHTVWVTGPAGKMERDVPRSRYYPFGPALRNRAIELYCGRESE